MDELVEIKRAATKVWYRHLAGFAAATVVAVGIPIQFHRHFGASAFANELDLKDVVFCLGSIAYLAEYIWREWRSLRAILALQELMTVEEFRIARAQERYGNAIRGVFFSVFFLAMMWWITAGQTSKPMRLELMLPFLVSMPLALRRHHELRQATA